MLTHLHIRNYALISHLDIDFHSGFSVMTGETGAGKSIILGALNLVMGARADTKSITEGEERCIIEATFSQPSSEIIIRRELTANGRSRSFVNDEVVTQAELKALARQLIDIHSQHESLMIGDDRFQIEVVDAIAGNDKQREAYSLAYQAYTQASEALRQAKAMAKKAQDDADYIQWQYDQLTQAQLAEGEMEQLEEEEYRLAHAEEIQATLANALNQLDSDNGALSLIHATRISSADAALADRLDSVEIELKDILADIQRLYDRTERDPQRLEQVQARISMLQSLMKKHHVQTVEDLIALRNQLATQVQRIENIDDELAQLQHQLDTAHHTLSIAAQALTASRQAITDLIASRLIEDMKQLGVPHANVAVELLPTDDFMETGQEMVQFLFAANLNQSLRPVSHVASGGEISRLMLCIKALIANTHALPTIIFDEIDTGVSGAIASQMGQIMLQMAKARQIIAITHLPQVAAKGEQHYLVYKQDTDIRTETHIRHLSPAQHADEIDKMRQL